MIDQEEVQILIQRSQCQDTVAFAQLVSSYQMLVYRVAFRMLCDEEEAKDVVQDTFVKVWLSLKSYNPSFRFSTWVYKITCNICYDRLRAKQKAGFNRELTDSDLHIASEEDIESEVANKELGELILRFTNELTPKQKLVFVLREIEGREISEIELITGLSPEKIKSNLYLARKHIREKINKINANL